MRPPARQRGISLVESLVALAVMAFGMLAIVGIQSTMRLNADIAKQRSEAVRVAQEEIERLRAYTAIARPAPGAGEEEGGAPDTVYAEIVAVDGVEVGGYTTNTTYTLVREVTDLPDRNHKVLRVTVSWVDRSGADQRVVLDTVIARSELAAYSALATSPAGYHVRRARGRHAAIPVQAVDLGNGKSAFKPPQAEGGAVVWVFDNVTGMMTGLCDVAGWEFSAEALANCSDNSPAHLLSGYVRFARSGTQPDAAEAERPGGRPRRLGVLVFLTTPPVWQGSIPRTIACFDDAPDFTGEAVAGKAVAYYCRIPANEKRVWSGYSTIVPQPFANDDPASAWSVPGIGQTDVTHRQCRYTPAASDEEVVPNWQHPRHYRIEYLDPDTGQLPIPMPPLPDQNFLVVDHEFTCPTDVPANPGAGDFVNSNTLEHLPFDPA